MRYFASCCLFAVVCGSASAQERTQIFFKEPNGMKVHWLTKEKGKTVYSKTPLNKRRDGSTSSRARSINSN